MRGWGPNRSTLRGMGPGCTKGVLSVLTCFTPLLCSLTKSSLLQISAGLTGSPTAAQSQALATRQGEPKWQAIVGPRSTRWRSALPGSFPAVSLNGPGGTFNVDRFDDEQFIARRLGDG